MNPSLLFVFNRKVMLMQVLEKVKMGSIRSIKKNQIRENETSIK
jgi:hypothetical protein